MGMAQLGVRLDDRAREKPSMVGIITSQMSRSGLLPSSSDASSPSAASTS